MLFGFNLIYSKTLTQVLVKFVAETLAPEERAYLLTTKDGNSADLSATFSTSELEILSWYPSSLNFHCRFEKPLR